MNEKQQIEEMARDLCECYVDHTVVFDAKATAEKMVDKGYRKQSECENIGTVHPVDEFICSNCGIALEGWTKVVTDEDDGEQYHYVYAFKHCPECGAKVKGGDEWWRAHATNTYAKHVFTEECV